MSIRYTNTSKLNNQSFDISKFQNVQSFKVAKYQRFEVSFLKFETTKVHKVIVKINKVYSCLKSDLTKRSDRNYGILKLLVRTIATFTES